jgi:hypothetical protein
MHLSPAQKQPCQAMSDREGRNNVRLKDGFDLRKSEASAGGSDSGHASC